MSRFPAYRPRRLRRSEALRRLVRETRVTVEQLVQPLFVVPGRGVERPVGSMPGIAQLSVDRAAEDCRRLADLGVPAVILFGIPEHKDARGSGATDPDGIIPRALRAIRQAVPGLLLITDVCLCEYTDHGHCGVVRDGDVDNDPTLELLAVEAVAHARAGADVIAPSDMMDGRVGAIRRALDAAGFAHLPIMSYAAKFASAFYGPFREAAESAPQFGDRRSYQMDPANAEEAMREVALDIEEGADIVLVKPALPNLDIVRRVKERFGYPVAAYQVSGEYAMVKAAAARGWLDEARAVAESLTAIRRAGADIVITYFAGDVARGLARS
ncbi:MAG: porphobilinogen synthase [Deltaproteobacteria bacterium]|nr:MAG: porphobilinogen synthase [Deltaproteobacteria bacterium]TMB16539.1 MAG: porphobilinogen synthase [Deltaproteobacteria bacterium]